MKEQIKATMKLVVTALVAGQFKEIEQLTGGRRLSADAMGTAISHYPGTLIMPPDSAFDSLDIVEIRNSVPRAWSVNMHLWTHPEGKSDLTVETTLTETEEQTFKIELDDIHVL